jgi:GNAT superfamily N-acetyltransferase
VVAVLRLVADDAPAVTQIVAGLPDYFDEIAAGKVANDLLEHRGWVLLDRHVLIGFAVAQTRSPATAEILWLAVTNSRRSEGGGTVLLDAVLDELAAEGIKVIEVKTLDRSAAYPPYEATRLFYERRGFVQLDTIDPLPGWGPGNPAAIYVAALAPTR